MNSDILAIEAGWWTRDAMEAEEVDRAYRFQRRGNEEFGELMHEELRLLVVFSSLPGVGI